MLGRKDYTNEEFDHSKAAIDSLMNNNSVMGKLNAIKLVPEQSVMKFQVGDPIELTAEQFERLAAAFFDELKRKFL